MDLIDFSQGDRRDFRADGPLKFTKPVMMYLGCLKHIQGITGNNLQNHLVKLRGGMNADIIAPIDLHTDEPELRMIRHHYNMGEIPPSVFTQRIYAQFFKPAIDACENLHDKKCIEKLKADLSLISIAAYSYGTSAVQQIAGVMAADLCDRFGNDELKGIRIFDICRSVKVVNMGPVGRFRSIDSDGQIHPLNFDDPYFSEAHTLFSQISFMMSFDKKAHRCLGSGSLGPETHEESYHHVHSKTGIEILDTASATQIVDFAGQPTLKFIKLGDVPEFKEEPDKYQHDIRTHINVQEKQRNYIFFPSLAVAPLLRAATASMLQEGISGEEWRASIRSKIKTPEQHKELVLSLHGSLDKFECLKENYEQSGILPAVSSIAAPAP